MIRVRNWQDLYEVDDKGNRWKCGAKPRRGPLEFVRCRVNGRAWSEGYREFLRVAGKDAAACFGTFIKLLELAADNDADHRGAIVDRLGNALDAMGIAHLLGFEVKDVRRSLEVLTDSRVAWLVQDSSGESGIPQEIPGTPRTSEESQEPESKPEDVAPDPVVMEFPIIGKGNPTWPLMESKVKEWEETYGRQIDVRAALPKCLQWLRDHPSDLKTPKGMPAFIGAWLKRDIDKGWGQKPVNGNGKAPSATDARPLKERAVEWLKNRTGVDYADAVMAVGTMEERDKYFRWLEKKKAAEAAQREPAGKPSGIGDIAAGLTGGARA